jgi:hypothetical protein
MRYDVSGEYGWRPNLQGTMMAWRLTYLNVVYTQRGDGGDLGLARSGSLELVQRCELGVQLINDVHSHGSSLSSVTAYMPGDGRSTSEALPVYSKP